MPLRSAKRPLTDYSELHYPVKITQKTYKTRITGTGIELMGTRQNLVIAARAAGVQCFDTVYTDLDNLEGFRQDVETIHLWDSTV